MPKCSTCRNTKPDDAFYWRPNGAISSTVCKSCRSAMNGRATPGTWGDIPKAARPHIRNIIGKVCGVGSYAYAVENVWRVAKMQKGVALCNFDEKWKPLMRVVKQHT